MAKGITYLKAAGRNLTKLRAHRGWTRRKMASLTGLKENILAKMESGSADTELAAWNRLSVRISVPLARLFSGNPIHDATDASNLASLTGLSAHNRRIVCELAEVFRGGV